MNSGYRTKRTSVRWGNVLIILIGVSALGYSLYSWYQSSQDETELLNNCTPTSQRVYVDGYVGKVLVVYDCPDIIDVPK